MRIPASGYGTQPSARQETASFHTSATWSSDGLTGRSASIVTIFRDGSTRPSTSSGGRRNADRRAVTRRRRPRADACRRYSRDRDLRAALVIATARRVTAVAAILLP